MTDLQYVDARMAFDKASAQEIRDLTDHVMEDGGFGSHGVLSNKGTTRNPSLLS